MADTPDAHLEKLAFTVPASQLTGLQSAAETYGRTEQVRVRFQTTAGKTSVLVIIDLRGAPEAVASVKAKINTTVTTFAVDSRSRERMSPILLSTLSFFGGLVGVALFYFVLR